MTQDVWLYRTEVHNDSDRRMRVVWFEFYYLDDGKWHGINVRNRPLGNADFLQWFGDDGDGLSEDGWLEPGAVAVCDPNWHFAFGSVLNPVKWSYLAVDETGRETLFEAEVPAEAAIRYSPSPPPVTR
ncbi:MAG: hypothetical protein H7A53_06870 [Akkermansiaceae bacterium]|nr:hypothetical protein [Akkermansiaceae bacterium]